MSAPLKNSEDLVNEFVEWRVSELLPKFEALTPYSPTKRQNGVKGEDIEGWKILAAKESSILKSYYPDPEPDENKKTYKTATSQITRIKKRLTQAAKTDLKDPQTVHQVNTIIKNFGNALSFLFSEYKSRSNLDYRKRVDVRRKKENRIELDLSPFIQRSYDILSNLENLQVTEWQDISCAIAMATGRRMAEVHLSASFKELDSHIVEFKGYLKGKSRKIELDNGKEVAARNYPFKIPTLVPANLVVKGLEWLDNHDKRFPPTEDPERVNKRWSKPLNQHVKLAKWLILDEGMTYHKFRGAYFRACTINDAIDLLDYLDYARQVLGDRDESTIKAYERFEIKKGSITRI